jgi:hypothetical protein
MQRHALFVVAVLAGAAASCGSSLEGSGGAPKTTTTTLPEWTDADCTMFTPAACRLDVAKASVGIDVHYPNTYFCRLQVVLTGEASMPEVFSRLASGWQATIGYGPTDQVIVPPEMPRSGLLEYDLGTEQLYLTRMTFTARSADTLAAVAASALPRSDVSIYATPLPCPR